jgi:hypothetical protein
MLRVMRSLPSSSRLAFLPGLGHEHDAQQGVGRAGQAGHEEHEDAGLGADAGALGQAAAQEQAEEGQQEGGDA